MLVLCYTAGRSGIPMPKDNYTLGEAFEYFRAQSNLSPKTLDTYAYAVQHFFAFLEGSQNAAPLSLAGPPWPGTASASKIPRSSAGPSKDVGASLAGPDAADRALSALGGQPQDVNLLAWFVNYLGQEVERAHADRGSRRSRDRRLEPATARLYGQALVTWFRFLPDELLLPDRFPAAAAIARAN